jgi:hypothetical protein
VLLYQRSFHLSFRKSVSLSVCQAVLFSFFLSLASFTHAESVTTANLSGYEFYYVLVDSADNNTVYALMGTKSTSPCYADGDGTKFCKRSMYLARVDRNQLNKLYLGDYYLSSASDATVTAQDKYLNSWQGAVAKFGNTVNVFFNHKASNGTYSMSSKLFIVSAPSGVNSLTKTSEKTPFSDNNWGWYPKALYSGEVEHFSYNGYQRCRDSQCGEQFSSSVGATVMMHEYRTSMLTDSQAIMPEVNNADIAAKIVAKATGVSFSSGRINGISTRASVGKTAEKYMMAGVYIRGTAQKKALVRATGKGLVKQGVNTSLDAKLEVYELATSTTTPTDKNDDWKQHSSYSAVQAAGGMPDSYDAALISGLNQGYYSMVVMPSGGSMTSGGGGTEGIGLVEVYDNDPASASRLSGISTRSYVGSAAADYMYAGLAIQGGSLRLLIRGLGKGLVAQGVAGALDDAIITVRKADGTVVDSNDNWQTHSSSSLLTQRGQAPKESSDAAMIINLFEGLYTIEVKSAKGGSGVALVEVYEIVD